MTKEVLDPSQVPEVADLLAVELRIMQLIDQNKPFYEALTELVAERNTSFEAADKKVRQLGVTCGPFVKTSESQSIDAEELFEELGPDKFAEVGGYAETTVTRKVDKVRFGAMASRGDIPKEVVEAVTKLTLRYKKPSIYNLP